MGIDAGYLKPGIAFAEVEVDCGHYAIQKYIYAEAYTPIILTKELKSVCDKLSQSAKDVQIIRNTVSRFHDLILKYRPKSIIVELPTGGAKSSAAIRSMAMATSMTIAGLVGIRYAAPWLEIPCFDIIHITPTQNKKGSTGAKTWRGAGHDQDKWSVWESVDQALPGIPWPTKKRKSLQHIKEEGQCWAMADALSCILTRVRNMNDARK